MLKIFEYFVRITTLPRHLTLTRVLHVLAVLCGLAVLYLLTLRTNEEGKIEDYLRRVWKRIFYLREKALSYHLAFINVTARAISYPLDRLFGQRLFSLQSMGVSLSLALFFTNSFFVLGGKADAAFLSERVIDCVIALALAFAPYFTKRAFGPTCREGGGYLGFRPLQCRYLDAETIQNSNPVERGVIAWAKLVSLACLCSSTWMLIWFLSLLTFIYREYLSFIFCVYCYPAPLRPFIVIIVLVIFVIFAAAASLFTLFSIVTRLSLKKLATVRSSMKAVGFLLFGSLPVPILIFLFQMVLLIFSTGNSSSNKLTLRDWIGVGSLAVFLLAFLINAAFFIAPLLFFSMAIVLLIHRLIWPMLERPIDKLHRVGLSKHPWIIGIVGATLIAYGLGGVGLVIKVLKFFGYGTS